MKVSDMFATEDIYDIVCDGDIPFSKEVYFKLVLFKKSEDVCKSSLDLFSTLKNFFKSYDFFIDIKEYTENSKNYFKLKDDTFLNKLEFIVKLKAPSTWFSSEVYYIFFYAVLNINLPDNWMISSNFIEENFLEVKTVSSKDINVENIFGVVETMIETKTPFSYLPDFSSKEEKMKWLEEYKRIAFGEIKPVSTKSAWDNVVIDKNIIKESIGNLKPFHGLFGIDPQIKMVLTPIIAAKESNGSRKAHSVLFGPAGCGKTTILDRLDDLIGKSNVLRLDAPCMTKSGLETLLLEMPSIPPVIIIEEIEKSSENNLRTLLGMMDERSEICKTTVSGSVTRNIDCLIYSTVNDIEKFNKYLDGALSSRFKNKIFLPRPNEQTIRLILERDINKNGGNMNWINPVVEFAKELNITDPRIILSFLINGDRLLDGSFQEDYRNMEKLKSEAGYGN